MPSSFYVATRTCAGYQAARLNRHPLNIPLASREIQSFF